MFKVLVIAYYFPPMGLSGVQRTLKFVKYMPENNWEPTVITTGKTAYYAHDISLLKEVEKHKIRVERTEGNDPNSVLSSYGTVSMPKEILRKNLSRVSKTIFIPDNKVFWARKAAKKARELLKNEDYDAIFVTIPPFSAFQEFAKLKKEFDIPLFVDYRDLWFGNHFAFYPTPYHKYKHKQQEKKALRSADRIIVVNRKIKETLLTNYQFLSFDDITIIPHGFDPDDFGEAEPLSASKKMKITYSGIFYENVTPKYFLRAFKQLLKTRPDIAAGIEIHFIGHFRKENARLVSKLGLNEYVFDHGYMDHADAVKKIQSSDILWVTLGNSKNMDKVTPGKLFEYFGTKKPIIACLPEGVARNMAEEYHASFSTDPENPDQIMQVLIDVYRLFKADKLPVPDDEYVNKFSRKYLTEQLTKQFQFFLREEV